MEDLKNILLNIDGLEKFQRVAVTHPIPWYIGIDAQGRWSLFCITSHEPEELKNSKMMSVFVGQRRDGKYGITFSLSNNDYQDLFITFCMDVIRFSSDCVDADRAADCVSGRYLKWMEAFKKNNGNLLTFEEIKGLVGELSFMKSELFPLYGVEKSIDCWGGTDYNDQDFHCDSTWYEVKSVVSGASSVKISSVEQLDTNTEGHLVVMYLDKTSQGDGGRVTLNDLYQEIVESISSSVQKERFKNRLLSYGYYFNATYDQFGFRLNGMDMYKVNNDFPCLRKKKVPISVQNIKYELSLPGIAAFKER
jgi:hypothetical protein